MAKKKKKASLLSKVRKKLYSKKKKPVNVARKKAKAKKTVSKKVVRKPKEDKFVVGFEEVVVKCPNCGREFRVVKSSGFSMEGMLCQRCAAGGGVGFGNKDL